MNIKRDMGVCRIFLLSCGIAAALAGVFWLAAGIVCAVDIAAVKHTNFTYKYYDDVSDVLTPWLMLAVGMITYHRFWGICSANSVSPRKQTACLAVMSTVFSALFACADIAFVKGVLQRIYGGFVRLSFEDMGRIFSDFYFERIHAAGSLAAADLSYPPRLVLLLFAATALYYCCFFLSGCFIMACIDSGRTKRSVYYLVTALFGSFLFSPIVDGLWSVFGKIPEVFVIIPYFITFYSSPVVFSYESARAFFYDPADYFIRAMIFIIITLASIHHAAKNPNAKNERRQRTQMPSLKNIRFRIKRFFGTLRLTALSAEYSAVCVIILWMLVNFGYAVYLGREIHDNRFSDFSPFSNCHIYFIEEFRLYSDIATPFILIAAAAIMIPRHTKLCAANSVSGKLQAVNGLLTGGLYSCVLAAADIIFSKTIISVMCGATRYTFFEKYIYSLYPYDFDNIMELKSDGIMQLFAVTALYYLAVFMTAYFYGQCIYNRSKFVGYAITSTVIAAALFGISFLSYAHDNDVIFIAALFLMLICLLASPHLMLVIIIPQINDMDSEISINFLIGMCAVYTIAMLALSMAAKPEISDRSNRIKRN